MCRTVTSAESQHRGVYIRVTYLCLCVHVCVSPRVCEYTYVYVCVSACVAERGSWGWTLLPRGLALTCCTWGPSRHVRQVRISSVLLLWPQEPRGLARPLETTLGSKGTDEHQTSASICGASCTPGTVLGPWRRPTQSSREPRKPCHAHVTDEDSRARGSRVM